MKTKRESLAREVEEEITYKMECGHCYTEAVTDGPKKEALDMMESDFIYAYSEVFGLEGWICRSCYEQEDEDWVETDIT